MSKKSKTTSRSKDKKTKDPQSPVTRRGDSKLEQELPTDQDIDVRRELAEAQRAGTEPLTKKFLEKVHGSGSTPEVSAMDLDADWERAEPVGEETVGGSVATPGQNVVDDIGDAVGVSYPDETSVTPVEVVEERDRRRWELDPASSEDYHERTAEIVGGQAGDQGPATVEDEPKDQTA
jgi:hypothetical protein